MEPTSKPWWVSWRPSVEFTTPVSRSSKIEVCNAVFWERHQTRLLEAMVGIDWVQRVHAFVERWKLYLHLKQASFCRGTPPTRVFELWFTTDNCTIFGNKAVAQFFFSHRWIGYLRELSVHRILFIGLHLKALVREVLINE
ncbi:hypothetical protein BRADI_1g21363v3 [Brachypodium distachyon]|uniref:Uncharacterized protein n=1 Tax=Brachypodium distachyon TaxID=15368 RepID=A0A0Q3GXJ8_BRADI|nr:hypothetical protein BRADI_1g21363v3 [Brachypodium distachyon]